MRPKKAGKVSASSSYLPRDRQEEPIYPPETNSYGSPDEDNSDLYDDDPVPRPLPSTRPAITDDALKEERALLFGRGSGYAPATRSDIVGIDVVLDQIDIVTHWLKHSHEYQLYQARLEPGILFEGDPGTGKTLVSRYIATQSEAHFVSVRDFPHNGAFLDDRDIAEMFKLAREAHRRLKKPVVLFWDEFEGSAADRNGYNTDKEQIAAVSQLTSELDGVHGKNEGLLLIGCTNYGDGIDQALKRPGRMGLHIEFNAPDTEGKAILLQHYLEKKITEGEIDAETLAHFFKEDVTASGIEEAVEESWRLSVMRSIKENTRPSVSQNDLVQVFLGRMIGPRPTFSKLSDTTKLRVAVHEAAHGIAALVYGIPLKLVTCRPGKKSLGQTFTAKLDHHAGTVEEARFHLRLDSAPLLAEEISGLGPGMGLSSDTDNATSAAMRLVDTQGQGSRSGYFSPSAIRHTRQHHFTPTLSEEVLARLDLDVSDLLEDALTDNQCLFRVKVGQAKLLRIAAILTERETMIGAEFKALIEEVAGDIESLRP